MTEKPLTFQRAFLGGIAVSLTFPLLVLIFGLVREIEARTADEWVRTWQVFYGGMVFCIAYGVIRQGRWKTCLALVIASVAFALLVGVAAPSLLEMIAPPETLDVSA